ncbi:hypothetical protein ACF05W_28050 [Streptomyces lydicus]|uniref:hypothetical protein n=1 Tax=Streptomyces lydicus TaxID=47763 RepID=UPI003700DF67
MPHHADPYEGDDLDDLPPPQPVHYAEQALLGALLLDPHRLDTIGRLTLIGLVEIPHPSLWVRTDLLAQLPHPPPAD